MSGQLIGSRYRLQTVVGRGGMATVWRAVDERLDRLVAVKLLDRADPADPATLERFDREARTAAKLSHPNIVAVHDVGHHGTTPYLVMELIDGPSLAARFTDRPLPVDQAIHIAGQICDALTTAHAAGVVHRDIKPANVLLTGDGTVKVCDFGIAHATHQQATGLTAPHNAVGTSEYMAPEQATGGLVDARTDLYALGCLLYAMLTGTPPFTGDNPMAVLWQHQHQPAPPVTDHRPDVPDHLRALLAALLAKNPADRPASADHVRSLLYGGGQVTPPAAARAAAPVLSRTQTLPQIQPAAVPAPSGGRFRLGLAGIAAVATGAAILAALAVGLLLTTNQPPNTAGPSETGSATATTAGPATAAAGSPADRIAALRATIDAQVQAGNLDAEDADELTDKLDDVDRELAGDRPDKAARRLGEVRKKLDALRKDDKINTTGYQVVRASLDELSTALRTTKDNQRDGDDE